MGLDVYVGSFTRYYAGDWETIIQQSAKEMGIEVTVERAHPQSEDAIRDPVQIREAILAWRQSLSQGLQKHLKDPLCWDEEEGTPYFTDKPAWDCYSDLILWAAYEEHPKLMRPQNGLEDYSKDPAFKASSAKDFNSRYAQLLRDVEIWLPCNYSFTFRAGDPSGNNVVIGSSVALHRQLRELNERTWKAGASDWEVWRQEGADHGCSLEVGARFAFSVLERLSGLSIQHKLPMKLDY